MNPNLGHTVTDLTLRSVCHKDTIEVIAEHFHLLQRLHIKFPVFVKSEADGIITSRMMSSLSQLTHLRVLILEQAQILPQLLDTAPHRALSSVESFQLLKLFNNKSNFPLELFCRTFAQYIPNVRELVVQCKKGPIRLTDKQIETNLKLFTKLQKHRFL